MIIFRVLTTYFLYFFFSSYVFSKEMIFEDFSKINVESNWEFISDQVMGGISSGSFNILKETNIRFLRMTGKVSLENNGGFIQVRKLVDFPIKKNIKGIRLKAKGNKEDYFIHLRTKFTILPWQYYQLKFTVDEKWKSYNLNIDEFSRCGSLLPIIINPKHIKSIAVVAFGKKYDVNIDIAEISFFK